MILVRIRRVIVQGVPRPHPELAERLDGAGIRPTAQRLRVLEELAREHNDLSAQELHRRLTSGGERIGLATVYRALGALTDAGLVDTLAHDPTETCYRLCASEHHHHLVCSGCHRVVELTGCAIGDWIAEVAGAAGFVATDHRLEVTGVCEACRARKTSR